MKRIHSCKDMFDEADVSICLSGHEPFETQLSGKLIMHDDDGIVLQYIDEEPHSLMYLPWTSIMAMWTRQDEEETYEFQDEY